MIGIWVLCGMGEVVQRVGWGAGVDFWCRCYALSVQAGSMAEFSVPIMLRL